METLLIVIIVVAAAVILAGLAFVFIRQNDRRRRELREGYGPEYHRTLAKTGDRGEAEKELRERQKRVKSFDLKPLSREDADRFSSRWQETQAMFVDDPKAAIGRADTLVQEVMRARGYPVGSEFDQRAADVSVDHPDMVQNYRQAHQIAQRNERGEADTEDLRQAVVHYRSLFEDLLETEEAAAETARR